MPESRGILGLISIIQLDAVAPDDQLAAHVGGTVGRRVGEVFKGTIVENESIVGENLNK